MIKEKILVAITILLFFTSLNSEAQNVFSVRDGRTFLNEEPVRCIGLRCSNALLSDGTTNSLIDNLDTYRSYGVNTISVFLMGSRYSNIYGFAQTGDPEPAYFKRMGKIIRECDRRNMIVLVGILYWGSGEHDLSNSYYDKWTQNEVNKAIVSTMKWLDDENLKNVFIDPDNEGMAERSKGFDVAGMISEAKKANPGIPVAYNGTANPPEVADLTIHYGKKVPGKPYIQSEGTPDQYWGEYSKEKGLNHYINSGIYTDGKKKQQIELTREHLERGDGYMLASTWLQNVPPNYNTGGDGTPCDPGIRWWLEFIRKNYR